MKTIDLRSDTVTRPTPAMRQAMANAEVGDDAYGEDPSVNRLEERVAQLLGKQAGVLVPSGSMGNHASLRALTRSGDIVLCGEGAHVLRYESGAAWGLLGLHLQCVGQGGFFDAAEVRAAVHPDDPHYAPTRAVAFENTHNRAGGRVLPYDALKDVTSAAREAGLALHLDGARLWNAVVATGTPALDWAAPFDSVTVCLSKGLGAPVGSVACGSEEVIREVRRARKMLGGGMRQAGILAAAGLYAIDHHIERLADDHANARRLAAGLEARGFRVDPPPETNMVMFEVDDTEAFVRETRARDLLINPIETGRFRAVTHLDASEADVDEALERIDEIRGHGIHG